MGGVMKAMVYDAYGSPENLELQEIAMPAVNDDKVLVKVHAASVNWHDWHYLTGTPFMARIMAGGLFKPGHGVLGSDLAGQVYAVGTEVEQFRPGDSVFGSITHGCFAEYVSVSEGEVLAKPANVTYEEAAAAGAAAFTALQGLGAGGQIVARQRVLINGASGGVGTFAVQIAKLLGAHVTGVCSTRNLEMVRSIGADRVIDYSQVDCTQGELRYDLIFDVAAKRSFAECRRVLDLQGVYVTTAFSPAGALKGLWTSMMGKQKMVALLAKPPKKKDLVFLKELLEGGKVRPVIDRRYPLDEVPAALRYLGEGHARGKIVIVI